MTLYGAPGARVCVPLLLSFGAGAPGDFRGPRNALFHLHPAPCALLNPQPCSVHSRDPSDEPLETRPSLQMLQICETLSKTWDP